MINWIKSLFHEEPEPGDYYRKDGEINFQEREDYREYKTGGGWGNKISFREFKEGELIQSVYGFKPHYIGRPRKGDLLFAEMESGNIGVFGFIEVDLKSDPSDMFFAKVGFVGYKKNLNLEKELENASR